jgi:hypothetical protein
MAEQATQTITIDGAEHAITEFSETVQRLVAIHTEWRNDLVKERLTVAKTEAAIRALDAELTQTIQAELAAKAEAAAPAPEEAPAA